MSANMTEPAIESITQPGQSEYEGFGPIFGTTLHPGFYDVYVDLDVYDEVDEINEDNNTAFMSFYVKPRSKPEEEEEENVQRKAVGPAPNAVPDLEQQIGGLKDRGQPLPRSALDFFEPRFGYDFGRVRIHSDASAAENARGLNAKAFTVGSNIVFGDGQYAAETTEGRRLLAHELTHVIQQSKPSH
jgi:hypothetical protein